MNWFDIDIWQLNNTHLPHFWTWCLKNDINKVFFIMLYIVAPTGSFSFPPPTSLKQKFYGLTSGFTRLIMKTKYVCHDVISQYVNFHI